LFHGRCELLRVRRIVPYVNSEHTVTEGTRQNLTSYDRLIDIGIYMTPTLDPTRKRVDQHEDEHVAMSIRSQRTYAVQVNHLKWMVRGTVEEVSLGHCRINVLTVWVLPNERTDHPVRN